MSHSAAISWLSSRNKPVPALDIFHQKSLDTLRKRTASLADLADIISLDPGMSIALFNKVNANRGGSSNPPRLDSIHSLLGLLGTPAVTNFVKRFAPLGSANISSDIRQAYHQLMSRSFHLAHQTKMLIELQGMNNTHEIQAAALLYNIGEIYACLFDFEQYQIYQQACRPAKNGAACAEPLFGFSFEELNLKLADKIHLPDLARESHRQSRSTGRKARSIQIAADIVRQAETGWHHEALTRAIKNAAEFLDLPFDVLRSKIVAASLDAARECPVDHVFPAIARIILLPDLAPKPAPVADKAASIAKPRPDTKPVIKTQNPAPAKPSFEDKIKALIQSPTTTQATIIGLVLNQLFSELQFSRVALLLLSKDKSALSTRMNKGLGTDSALSKLQIKMSQSGLFKNLMTKPQSLWVNTANFKKYETLLPGSFRASCQSENFFLMSLFIGEKPIGLFFCDSTQKLDDILYKKFKSNLLLTGKALTFLSQRSIASPRNINQPVAQ